jgi:glycosyltransferase involved in cell wall biosynthesis
MDTNTKISRPLSLAFLTTDNREQHGNYHDTEPYFGTAMDALLQGFAMLPEQINVHVISCTRKAMKAPTKLSENIWFHQPMVPKLGWGRTGFLGCAWAVRKQLNDIQPDVVHGQGTERDCSMGAVLSGFPNILTIHGNMRVHAQRPEQQGNHYYKMAAALESFCLKRTGGVIAISTYTQQLVEKLTRKTWLLPNAVDRKFFDIIPNPLPVPKILFVGSLDERKNPLGLLKACEGLLRGGKCTLALAGQFHSTGNYGKKVMSMAESMPGLTFLGFLDRDALAKEFASSSLLVLPTFEDNCPMVLLEAMAAGVPIAASRVGGIPDLVEDKVTGLLFDPNNTEEITESIEALLLRRPENFPRIAENSRALAIKRFHPQVIAKSHLEFYRELISHS